MKDAVGYNYCFLRYSLRCGNHVRNSPGMTSIFILYRDGVSTTIDVGFGFIFHWDKHIRLWISRRTKLLTGHAANQSFVTEWRGQNTFVIHLLPSCFICYCYIFCHPIAKHVTSVKHSVYCTFPVIGQLWNMNYFFFAVIEQNSSRNLVIS